MASTTRTATEAGDLAERRVTPLELFFDLVFVFALTQVTGFLADHTSRGPGCCAGSSAARGVVVGVGYWWLTNAVPTEEALPARLVILAAMVAMLVASPAPSASCLEG